MYLRRAILSCLFALAVGMASGAFAQVMPVLHKGINFSSWLANAQRQPLFLRDFLQVKQAGFDHIRLPFNPEAYGFSFDDPAGAVKVNLAPLDKAIALSEGQGLKVVLDLHPGEAFMKRLEYDPEAEKKFVAFWAMLARHYQPHDPGLLIFELLNEPQYYHGEARYHLLAEKLIKTIRAIDTARVIVVGLPNGSSLDALKDFEPFAEPRLIYSFHFYEPYIVTHQGIHMGFEKEMTKSFRNVPYPSSKVDRDAAYYAPNAPDPQQAAAELKDYTDASWNEARIKDRIDLAKAWGDQHHVPVICGEFGVLRNHIDSLSRYRWIEDVRKALEADGIGWELWDYTDLMGITQLIGQTSTDPGDGSVRLADPAKGSRRLEAAAIRALGLHGAKS